MSEETPLTKAEIAAAGAAVAVEREKEAKRQELADAIADFGVMLQDSSNINNREQMRVMEKLGNRIGKLSQEVG